MTMQKIKVRYLGGRQKGATLIVALVVLLIIMMIGVTAVTTSNTQISLAGNLQFEDIAMNNAEAAVVAGERWLAAGTHFDHAGFTSYSVANSPELYPKRAVPVTQALPWTMTWGNSNSLQVAPNQRYTIELLATNQRLTTSSQVLGCSSTSTGCNQVNVYAVTGQGLSARGATKYVQSHYSVLSCTCN